MIDYSQLLRPIFNRGTRPQEVVDTWNEVEREEVSQSREGGGCSFIRGGGGGSSGDRWPLIDRRVDIIIEGVNGQSMNGRDFDTIFRAIVMDRIMKKLWEKN